MVYAIRFILSMQGMQDTFYWYVIMYWSYIYKPVSFLNKVILPLSLHLQVTTLDS